MLEDERNGRGNILDEERSSGKRRKKRTCWMRMRTTIGHERRRLPAAVRRVISPAQ